MFCIEPHFARIRENTVQKTPYLRTFYVVKIEESVLNKIENPDKDNNTKLLIEEFSQRNYPNEEMKHRDIYNNKYHKLR